MSRSTCRLLAGILLVLLSDSVSRLAQQGEQVWYLPGAAETAGKNGAVYSSTLTITNPGSELAQLQINFIPYAGILAPAAVDQVISAGETLRVERVLSTLFSLNASAGTLVLNSNRDIYCLPSTSNIANPVGTYGLAVKPVLSQDRLHAGQTGQSIWVSEKVDFRTNVAVALLEANSAVGVSVYDNAGFLRGRTTVSSAVPVSWQSPIPDLVGPLPLPLGRVQFEVVKGSAIGYTAVVDNVTGDGIAVVAQELSAGVSDWILNGVAHSPGVGGTYWSTDVRIFNPNPEAVDLSIKSLGISGESRSILRTVSGDGLLELTDVLGPNGLQVSQASAGAVRFQASKALPGRWTNQ